MLGAISDYFRKRAEQHDAADRFYATVRKYQKLDSRAQIEFAIHLAYHWRTFLANFPEGPAAFAKASDIEQTDFLNRIQKYQSARVQDKDLVDAETAGVIGLYLNSIKTGNQNFEQEIAAILDPITRKGWLISSPPE